MSQANAVAIRRDDAPAALTDDQAAVMERVLMLGDLSPLSEAERVSYYHGLCRSMRLNPATKPFEYIVLDKKLTLYALKNCTDQLRNRDRISTELVAREVIDGVVVVTARASAPDGRTEDSTGAVSLVKEGGGWGKNEEGRNVFTPDGTLIPLKPDDRANAFMKAETKAKRRATLSMCGLSMIDETELDTIDAGRVRRVRVDERTGAIAPANVRALAAGGDEPPDLDPQTADWLSAIDGAGSLADLNRVGEEMTTAKVDSNALRMAYKVRKNELARVGG